MFPVQRMELCPVQVRRSMTVFRCIKVLRRRDDRLWHCVLWKHCTGARSRRLPNLPFQNHTEEVRQYFLRPDDF